MELRTTLIALVIGVVFFAAAFASYGDFITSYSINTSEEMNPTYEVLRNISATAGDIVNVGEVVAKEVQGGNVSSGGVEPQITMWRSGYNTISLLWTATPLTFKVMNIMADKMSVPRFYVGAIYTIIIIIIAFAIAGAVLQNKI